MRLNKIILALALLGCLGLAPAGVAAAATITLEPGFSLDIPQNWLDLTEEYAADPDVLAVYADGETGDSINLVTSEADDLLIELLRTDSTSRRASLAQTLITNLRQELRREGGLMGGARHSVYNMDGCAAWRLEYNMSNAAQALNIRLVQYMLPWENGLRVLTLVATDGSKMAELERGLLASLRFSPDLRKKMIPYSEEGRGYNLLVHSSLTTNPDSGLLYGAKIVFGIALALLAIIGLIVFIKYKQGYFRVEKRRLPPAD